MKKLICRVLGHQPVQTIEAAHLQGDGYVVDKTRRDCKRCGKELPT